MSGSSLNTAWIPLEDGAEAVYNSSGFDYFRHPDWLGLSRLASTPSRGIAYDTAYAAFGEPYAVSGANSAMSEMRFAGHNSDMLNQGSEPIYDAWCREYRYVQRRWLQPDPSGLAAVNPGNPQTWNRYSYVMNQPLNYLDVYGLHIYKEQDGCTFNGTTNTVHCPMPQQLMYGWFGANTIMPYSLSNINIGGYIETANNNIHKFMRQAFCDLFAGLVSTAQHTNSTIGIGIGGSAGVGIFFSIALSGSMQVVADRNGNLGMSFNIGGNPGYGVFGVGAIGGGQIMVSTANSIYDLRGGSYDVGASGGTGVAIGGDLSFGNNTTTITGTMGAGIGGKGTALTSDYTFVPTTLSTNCKG